MGGVRWLDNVCIWAGELMPFGFWMGWAVVVPTEWAIGYEAMEYEGVSQYRRRVDQRIHACQDIAAKKRLDDQCYIVYLTLRNAQHITFHPTGCSTSKHLEPFQ